MFPGARAAADVLDEAGDAGPCNEHIACEEGVSDEEDADDILVNVSDAMPDGYRVMPPPFNEQLEFKGERAVELVDCMLLFNWTAVGWVAGRIVSANIDGRRTVKVQSIGFKQELVCDCRRFLVLSFYPSMHCNVGEWHLHESQL